MTSLSAWVGLGVFIWIDTVFGPVSDGHLETFLVMAPFLRLKVVTLIIAEERYTWYKQL